jgi:hypothetical protein
LLNARKCKKKKKNKKKQKIKKKKNIKNKKKKMGLVSLSRAQYLDGFAESRRLCPTSCTSMNLHCSMPLWAFLAPWRSYRGLSALGFSFSEIRRAPNSPAVQTAFAGLLSHEFQRRTLSDLPKNRASLQLSIVTAFRSLLVTPAVEMSLTGFSILSFRLKMAVLMSNSLSPAWLKMASLRFLRSNATIFRRLAPSEDRQRHPRRFHRCCRVFQESGRFKRSGWRKLLQLLSRTRRRHRPDIDRAVSHYRRAASLGNPDAPFNLGRCLEYRKEIGQDPLRAAKYYRLSAEKKHSANRPWTIPPRGFPKLSRAGGMRNLLH